MMDNTRTLWMRGKKVYQYLGLKVLAQSAEILKRVAMFGSKVVYLYFLFGFTENQSVQIESETLTNRC